MSMSKTVPTKTLIPPTGFRIRSVAVSKRMMDETVHFWSRQLVVLSLYRKTSACPWRGSTEERK